MRVEECGVAILNEKVGSTNGKVKLQNVLHVPSYKYPLVSVKVMDQKWFPTLFSNRICSITNFDDIVLTAGISDSLYALKGVAIQTSKSQMVFVATLNTLHERFIHFNKDYIEHMKRRRVVHGVQISGGNGFFQCEICAAGKAYQAHVPETRFADCAKEMLHLVHTGICDLIEATSIDGT